MYEKFFFLDELPFDGLPNQRFYYVGSNQHQALELLSQNLSRNGAICVLYGPSGSGKTTLVRMLIRSLPDRMRIIAIDDPRLDEHMLLATILRASGIVATSYESIAELTLKIRKMLEKSVDTGIMTTVICDEAQGLSDAVLEQIRLISNIEGKIGRMVNFLLVGQEDLISHIQKKEHHMLYGRIKAFAKIPALKRDEVQSYVNYRMQQAGCVAPVFSNRALNSLYKTSDGLPRLINAIADRALSIAYKANKRTVSALMIKKASIIVRNPKSFYKNGFKWFIKSFAKYLISRLSIAILSLFIALSTFYIAYKYLPATTLDSQSIKASVSQDEVVLENYQSLVSSLSYSRTKSHKKEALFSNAAASSVFKSDAIANLIGLWGYARKDGEIIGCDDLDYVENLSLGCSVKADTLLSIKKINRPAVISLRDANLIPFYAVLSYIDGSDAELILDGYIFKINISLLDKIYDGSYTVIRLNLPDFSNEQLLERNEKEYLSLFNNIFPNEQFKKRSDLKRAIELFSKLSLDEQILLYEKYKNVGPNLSKSAFREIK